MKERILLDCNCIFSIFYCNCIFFFFYFFVPLLLSERKWGLKGGKGLFRS
jgi:hypothetical protein